MRQTRQQDNNASTHLATQVFGAGLGGPGAQPQDTVLSGAIAKLNECHGYLGTLEGVADRILGQTPEGDGKAGSLPDCSADQLNDSIASLMNRLHEVTGRLLRVG